MIKIMKKYIVYRVIPRTLDDISIEFLYITNNRAEAEEMCLAFAEEELYYKWFRLAQNSSTGWTSLVYHVRLINQNFYVGEVESNE